MRPPSWPQLAGWMATAEVGPSRGAATLRLDSDSPPVSCTFVHRPGKALRLDLPDGTVVLHAQGSTVVVTPDGSAEDASSPLEHELSPLLDGRRSSWERSDFHIPLGDVAEVRVAGRLGWQVFLQPPRSKVGPLEYVVDDETGRRLREANAHADAGFVRQLDRWEMVDHVDDDEFVHLGHRAEDVAERRRQRAAERAALEETLPTIRSWPPGFSAERPWPPDRVEEQTDPQLVQLYLPSRFTPDHDRVWLTRAPTATPPADPPGPEPVHRWETGGWAYAMTVQGQGLEPDELRRVQASVVEREIDD